eukprot:CAMPEP_0174866132 /NCGR_PEP_ID=MMETSP1114-20130205/61565_1 /TAXON_ID=312471 /ORGANISM="Neobodo designis, Strain CCAP 1951/1" /LENGTH=191 /DNA_ID=CAMNT_0016101275 /DNA_START=34 /DNA_END=609 /DNA_ORIENTATION=-
MACRKFTASGDDRRSALVRRRFSAVRTETAQLAPEQSSLPLLEQAAQHHAIQVAEAHLTLRFPPLEVAPQHRGIVFETLVKACTPVLASNAEFANAIHDRRDASDTETRRSVRAICAPHVRRTLRVCRAICPPESETSLHTATDHDRPRSDGMGESSWCFVDEMLSGATILTPAGSVPIKKRGARNDDMVT